jgi:putative ABC transport system permease protein
MTLLWMRGLLRRRLGRTVAIAGGVATAVAMVAGLGSFLAASQATMTARSIREVAVDWQVQLTEGASLPQALHHLASAPGTTAALPVDFVTVPGLQATTGGSQQTTGGGVLLGVPTHYSDVFPTAIRVLSGSADGAVVAQQTAANLHVGVGDTVQIVLPHGPPVGVTLTGIVDFPQANSLFQTVGAPPQSQPAAPPDNVVALPRSMLTRLFSSRLAARPDAWTEQIHVARDNELPASPAAAFAAETAAAHNTELALAGAGLVGDNLGAALDAARSDALYAEILFLFLATPGIVLSAFVAASVAGSGAARRRSEQELLRIRGADRRAMWWLACSEVAVTSAIAVAVGLLVAYVLGAALFGGGSFGASRGAALAWFGAAALAGVAITGLTVLMPVIGDLRRRRHGAADQGPVRSDRGPWFARWGIDVLLLVIAGLVTWASSRNQYALVLAPEGVPSISVSYWALAGPLLLWLGGGLMAWRLVDLTLRRGKTVLSRSMRPVAGSMARIVVASASRQRAVITRSAVLVALAVSFAVSTSVFNSTYQAQAEVDARLTNGGDVAVTESPGAAVSPAAARQLEAVDGVSAVEPIQHRFAYVGSDLQDLYGVRTSTIVDATSLQDAYFAGGTARGLIQKLADDPSAVLVSQETVTDFQLTIGDKMILRLQDEAAHRYRRVPFTYVGVVKEFPTAPSDSFIVANADYIAAQTHSDAVGAFLIDVSGSDPATVADAIRAVVGPTVRVTDIGQARGQIGTTLTSVDLHGLTRLELGAAGVLAVAAAGLVFGLRLNERRRTSAIAAAVGLRGRLLSSFITVEALVVLTGGLLLGSVLGWVLSDWLIRVLTGVFDPPPETPSAPWLYLTGLAIAVVLAVGLTTTAAVRWARSAPVSLLRDE